jgi:hypothetical protein
MRVLAYLLTALGLLLFVPAAHAARGMEIGVQDDAQFLSSSDTTRAAAFAHARALGAGALRANVPWARVATAPGAYDLSAYDRLVDEAALNGMRVQLTLAGPAPAWATADHQVSSDHPDPAAFAQFAGTVAARYAGRVRALSIWNEPNWHNLLKPERICGRVKVKVKAKGKGKGKHKAHKARAKKRKVCVKTSARVYRGLYTAGYAAIKAAAPGMPVWMGETNPYVNRRNQSTAPLAWLRQLACADPVVKGCKGVLRADGYAHHPYAFDRSPTAKRSGRDNVTIANLGALSKALKKLRKRIRIKGGSIYLTEFAYYSSGPNAKPEKKRAKWTRKAFEIALKAPKVRQLLYYQLIDPPVSEAWRTGLIGASGKAHPAYGALVGFAKKNRKALAKHH